MANLVKFEGTAPFTPISFTDANSVFRITEWVPGVAVRRRSLVAGPAYEDVDEEMTLSIMADTPVNKNVSRLAHLCDLITNWSQGGDQGYVSLTYQAKPGDPVYSALVVGPVAPGVPMLELPHGYMQAANTGLIDGVKLRFKRRGLWLPPPTTTTTGTVYSPFFQTLPAPAGEPRGTHLPLTLQYNSVGRSTLVCNSFILTGQTIIFTDAADATSPAAAGFSRVDDITNKADGKILRYTPSTTSEKIQKVPRPYTLPDPDSDSPWRTALFFNYRNNSATTSFKVRLGDNTGPSTPPVVIPAGVSDPKWVYAGSLTASALDFYIAITASAASGSLDIDTIVGLDAATLDARVIAIGDGVGDMVISPTPNLIIDHRLATHSSPLIKWHDAIAYQGNAYLSTPYDQIKVTVLAAIGGYWTAVNPSSDYLMTWLTYSFRKGVLSP